MGNSTEILFFLQGLSDTVSSKRTYFILILLVYLFTLLANLTLIVTIILEKTLHEPMLVFLCNLCVNGILGASILYPKILVDLLSDLSVTSYEACLGQIVVLYSYTNCEYTTLAMMAYDRYIAICKPLNYHSIITPQKVMKLLLFTWLSSICESVVVVGLIARLPLCGFKIEKIYCTAWAVVKLSCVDTSINNIVGYTFIVFNISLAVLVVISYVYIVRACVRSPKERSKFMQTCLPHLIALTNFFIALGFDLMYTRYGPTDRLQALRNFMSLDYLIVPPLLNPLIYGLRLNQIRRKIFRMCSQKTRALK
ncbi:olfactory receptor 2G3-like isoform X2 [Anguilla anguilla]|uniref:olfactory receptor 2G3-like isoform X1 n=1 Tax=Anguilla anguilla TaxID=7936 RepID=UPI0015A88FCB|nr:olfactory receptor 2G3-like isoform X1 [Anguilla anguilla]XP_035242200.1 olfactory receptor 2G3-like isoform X2 [Anguilla anguilla]